MVKTILITGSSGFIGKNLVEYLSKKHEYNVLAPAHSELELLDDNAVREFFEKNNVDVVIHAANFGGSRKQTSYTDVFEKNMNMFSNLTKNSSKFNNMIFLGSGAEYDRRNDIIKVKESDFGKSIPEDDYGKSKFECSKLIEGTDNIINLRLFGVFGKYEDYEIRFISNIICRILFDLPVEINQNMHLDFIFVEDVCRIIEFFIENNAKHKFYNVGPSEHVDLLTIAEKIKKISGKEFEIKVKKQGMNKEYTCDNALLMEELGNFEFTEIDNAISNLYKWYEENKDSIKKENLLKY